VTEKDAKPGIPVLPEGSSPSPEVQRIAAQLVPVLYEELKRTARRTRSRLAAGATLQTTALIHEAYLRLGPERRFNDQTHFLRASALAMRHALITYAQVRFAAKRGGGAVHLTLSNATGFSIESDEGLVALDEALQRLALEAPRLAEVVECRFFGGLTEEETAQALDSSVRTIQREWVRARAWLFRELSPVVNPTTSKV
jgi:RNA polymerase sigma factor (TIGR02999 family)